MTLIASLIGYATKGDDDSKDLVPALYKPACLGGFEESPLDNEDGPSDPTPPNPLLVPAPDPLPKKKKKTRQKKDSTSFNENPKGKIQGT